MKRLFAILIVSSAVPALLYAADTYSRIGISLGGTHLVGLNLEYYFYENSIGLNFGSWEFQDLCVSLQLKRYFSSSPVQPYIGIGIWEVMAFSDTGIGYLTLLNFPAGVDWKFSENNYLGLEADLNYALYVTATGGSPSISRPFVFLPGVYYRYQF